ncbi:hypothetical protein SGPA1_40443 [Streptomyces misionensis JCM 4497]
MPRPRRRAGRPDSGRSVEPAGLVPHVDTAGCLDRRVHAEGVAQLAGDPAQHGAVVGHARRLLGDHHTAVAPLGEAQYQLADGHPAADPAVFRVPGRPAVGEVVEHHAGPEPADVQRAVRQCRGEAAQCRRGQYVERGVRLVRAVFDQGDLGLDSGTEPGGGVGRVGAEPPAVRQHQLGHARPDADRPHPHQPGNGTGPGDPSPRVVHRDAPVALDPEYTDLGGGQPLTAHGLHRIAPQLIDPHASPSLRAVPTGRRPRPTGTAIKHGRVIVSRRRGPRRRIGSATWCGPVTLGSRVGRPLGRQHGEQPVECREDVGADVVRGGARQRLLAHDDAHQADAEQPGHGELGAQCAVVGRGEGGERAGVLLPQHAHGLRGGVCAADGTQIHGQQPVSAGSPALREDPAQRGLEQPLGRRGAHLLPAVLRHHLGEQGLLRAEVAEYERLVHPGTCGDVPNGGRLVPPLGEHRTGRVENTQAGAPGVAGPVPAGLPTRTGLPNLRRTRLPGPARGGLPVSPEALRPLCLGVTPGGSALAPCVLAAVHPLLLLPPAPVRPARVCRGPARVTAD